jgi:asparagine synthetase B (glutamine-hydrolysing)
MCGIAVSYRRKLPTRLLDGINNRGPSYNRSLKIQNDELHFHSSVLAIRDGSSSAQPIETETFLLCYNGEIYECDGWGSDTDYIEGLFKLIVCPGFSSESILERIFNEILLTVKGPFALVLFDKFNKVVYLLRDRLGRRSLTLTHNENHEFIISSVCPDIEIGDQQIEIQPGVHSMELTGPEKFNLKSKFSSYNFNQFWSSPLPTFDALNLLDQAFLRVVEKQIATMKDSINFGVLFSGGLDSTLIAAYIGRVMNENDVYRDRVIPLVNVSFAEDSPDKRTAIVSYADLDKKFPGRFSLVIVDVNEDDILSKRDEIIQLMSPKDTVMDFNISAALYFAAGFDKCQTTSVADPAKIKNALFSKIRDVCLESEALLNNPCLPWKPKADSPLTCTVCNSRKSKPDCAVNACKFCCLKTNTNLHCKVHKVNSPSVDSTEKTNSQVDLRSFMHDSLVNPPASCQVLFVGHGADELFGGYGRYITASKRDAQSGRKEEMIKDLERFWTRNLGRDDRCLSASGKEVRHPFWDEDLLDVMQSMPMEPESDNKPDGVILENNKWLLRKLMHTKIDPDFACLKFKKRAIQFGTRISQILNVRLLGSHSQGKGDMKLDSMFSGIIS